MPVLFWRWVSKVWEGNKSPGLIFEEIRCWFYLQCIVLYSQVPVFCPIVFCLCFVCCNASRFNWVHNNTTLSFVVFRSFIFLSFYPPPPLLPFALFPPPLPPFKRSSCAEGAGIWGGNIHCFWDWPWRCQGNQIICILAYATTLSLRMRSANIFVHGLYTCTLAWCGRGRTYTVSNKIKRASWVNPFPLTSPAGKAGRGVAS